MLVGTGFFELWAVSLTASFKETSSVIACEISLSCAATPRFGIGSSDCRFEGVGGVLGLELAWVFLGSVLLWGCPSVLVRASQKELKHGTPPTICGRPMP